MRESLFRLLLIALVGLLVAACGESPAGSAPQAGPEANWPQWRGPHRNGISTTPLLPPQDDSPPQAVWRTPIGEGFGSLTVAQGRLFVLMAEGSEEFLAALDARSGQELWRLSLGNTFLDATGNGPRSTPTIDGEIVYALGTEQLVALNIQDGTAVWRYDLPPGPQWGYSSSPLIEGDLLIIQGGVREGEDLPSAQETAGSKQGTAVSAFHKKTGAVVWSRESGHPGYASPMVVELHGKRQLIAFLGTGLVSLEPETGNRLWFYPWSTPYHVNAADPVFIAPDRFFISSAYDNGAALIQVQRNEQGFAIEERWRNQEMRNHFSSSVFMDGYLYGFDHSTLKCLDITNGQELWRQRGFQKGSLVIVDQRLLILGEDGTLAIAEATPKGYKELVRFQALEQGSSTAPAVAGPWLYLRDHQEISCFYLGPTS